MYYLYKYSKVKKEKSQKLLGEVFTLFSLYCDPCSGRASSFKIPRCSKFLEGAHLVINLFLLYCQYNGCTLKFYLLLEMISKLHITVFVMFLIQLPVSFSAAKNLKKNYISALPTLPFLAARLETPFFLLLYLYFIWCFKLAPRIHTVKFCITLLTINPKNTLLPLLLLL